MAEKRSSVSPSSASSPPRVANAPTCQHSKTMNARCACGVVHLIPLYDSPENADLRKEIDALREKIQQDAHEARILNEYSLKLERELTLKGVQIEEERNASAQQLSSSKMETHSLKVENEVLRKHISVLEGKISTRPSPDRGTVDSTSGERKDSHVALEVLLKNITFENTNLRKLLGHKESVINYLTNLAPTDGSRSRSSSAVPGGRSGSGASTTANAEAVEAALTRHHLVDQANQKQLLFEALARIHTIVNSAAVRRSSGSDSYQELRRECEVVYSDLGLSLDAPMPLECSSLVLLPSAVKPKDIPVRSVAVPAPAAAPVTVTQPPTVPFRRLRNPAPEPAPSTTAAPKGKPSPASAQTSRQQQLKRPSTTISQATGGVSSEILRLREERARLEKQSEELTLQLYAGGTVSRKPSPFRSRSLESRHTPR